MILKSLKTKKLFINNIFDNFISTNYQMYVCYDMLLYFCII